MTPVLLMIAIPLGLWGLHIWRYPYVTCAHCSGSKRKYASDEEHYAHTDCWWCYGSGERYRLELRWMTLF